MPQAPLKGYELFPSLRRRRQDGRKTVLLTKEAADVLVKAAKLMDRSQNKSASKIIIEYGIISAYHSKA